MRTLVLEAGYHRSAFVYVCSVRVSGDTWARARPRLSRVAPNQQASRRTHDDQLDAYPVQRVRSTAHSTADHATSELKRCPAGDEVRAAANGRGETRTRAHFRSRAPSSRARPSPFLVSGVSIRPRIFCSSGHASSHTVKRCRRKLSAQPMRMKCCVRASG